MKRTLTAAKVLGAAVALATAGHGAAQAQTWWDPAFYATGTSVTVKFLGGDASYFDTMQWFNVPFTSISFINVPGPDIVNYDLLGGVSGGQYTNLFVNKTRTNDTKSFSGSTTIVNAGTKSAVGSTANITTTTGSEVLLGLFVNNERTLNPGPQPLWDGQDGDDYTYFSGPGRNVDHTYHLRVQKVGANQFDVYGGGWEDIRNGGDLDYNDLLFSIEGVTVTPEPVSMVMLGTGLFGMAGAAAAKRRRRREESVA